MTIMYSSILAYENIIETFVCVFALLKMHRYGELIGAMDVEIITLFLYEYFWRFLDTIVYIITSEELTGIHARIIYRLLQYNRIPDLSPPTPPPSFVCHQRQICAVWISLFNELSNRILVVLV